MSEEMEWKPCPFCGSEPSISHCGDRESFEKYQEEKGESVLAIWCSNHDDCSATLTLVINKKIEYSDALRELNRRWNRRTP